MFRLFSLIFRNVTRNRRRSILTLCSTAVSLGVLTLVVALYQGFFYAADTSPAETLRLICRHRVSLTQSLPASHEGPIKSIPGVVETSAFSWFGGKYIDDKNQFGRFAVTPTTFFDIYSDWKISPEDLAAFKEGRTSCAISDVLAKKFKLSRGDRMTITGDIYPVDLELTVAAIFEMPVNGEMLVFHREYLSELLPKTSEARDSVGTYLIRAESADVVPRIARAIDTRYDNSPYPTRTESEKEFGRSFLAFLGNVKLFLAAICAAVTFTILLVSANTIAMSVRERTREMAILRTLGYAPGEILQLVLVESVLISVIGGVLGIGLGYGLTQWMIEQSGGFMTQGVKWQGAVIVLGLATLIGLAAATVPAVLVARKNVVESLRFTG